jgi:hypothetical protein
LAIVKATPARVLAPPSPLDKLAAVLAQRDRPFTLAELRQPCRMRTAHVCQALAALTAQGRVHKTAGPYQLVLSKAVSANPFRVPSEPPAGNGNG